MVFYVSVANRDSSALVQMCAGPCILWDVVHIQLQRGDTQHCGHSSSTPWACSEALWRYLFKTVEFLKFALRASHFFLYFSQLDQFTTTSFNLTNCLYTCVLIIS